MASRYLIATGNWSNPAIWSASNGGAGGAGVPSATDSVFIDSNYSVTIDADASCQSVTHSNGTISLGSHTLSVGYGGFTSQGSTARTVALGSGTLHLTGDTQDGTSPTFLNLDGSNLTVSHGTSLIVLDCIAGDVNLEGNSQFTTGTNTFNDVQINLGAGTTNRVTLDIIGSPTFRSLIIQSKNSAAHTVTFDSANITVNGKLILTGSSATNRLRLTSTYDQGGIYFTEAVLADSSTVYGQFVNVTSSDGTYNSLSWTNAAGDPPPAYLGSTSLQADPSLNNSWLLEDPPKVASLVDPLTAPPASNTNWTISGTVSTVTSGFGGGGYVGTSSGARMDSTDTYDLYNSALVFERPVATITNNNSKFGIGVSLTGENAGFVAFTSASYSPSSETTTIYSGTSTVSQTMFSYPITASKYVKISLNTINTLAISYSSDGSSWTTSDSRVLTSDEVLKFRSVRVSGIFRQFSATGGYPVGSVNVLPGPQPPIANFTATPRSGVAALTVQFTDTTTGIPTSWSWNFGDGQTSTAQNPSHTYQAAGSYTVTLTATNSLGTNTNTQTSYITATLATISPDSIASAESVSTVTLQPGTANIGPLGDIASAESVNGPSGISLTISPASISSSEAFGEPVLTAAITGIGDIPSAESVGNISIAVMYVTPDSIVSAESVGAPLITMNLTGLGDIPSEEAIDPPTFTQSPPPPPPPADWTAVGKEDEKVYIYKVYTHDGQYIGVWNDVVDSLEFTQQINTPGTTTTVQLGRSANTKREVRASLITDNGDYRVTQDGERRTVTYETSNTVGEDTDVDLNYNVDVYVNYGEFAHRITQDGERRITQDGSPRVATSGAPLGTPVFRGFILDYSSVYGDNQSGVTVTLSSHGYELSNEVIRNGEITSVTYSTQEIGSIVKSILDTNPGMMTYDAGSIDDTATSITANFQLNTKLEGIQSAFDQTPDGWYWYGNVADNNIYLKQAASTPTHTFLLGYHIISANIKRSLENLVNEVYFVGGQTNPNDATTTLFKKYDDTTSQTSWRKGLERITDRRYTLATSIANRANKDIAHYKDPVFTTPLVISSGRYDLESIKLGDMVGFGNFGNFVDALVLQIVSLSYTPTQVTIQLGELLERQVDAVADVESDLANEQYNTLPSQPS